MTAITIRVQAKGGMFLGPDSFNGAIITLKNVHTQKTICSGFTNAGNSGTRLTEYSTNASPNPIITPNVPVSIYWLIANDDTVKFTADLGIEESTLIEFSAKIPLPEAQGDQFISMTQWVSPNHNPSVGSGFILEIPGLWVQPEVVASETTLRIRAKVTMMCGCEVNDNSPWIPNDFEVSASIKNRENKLKVPLQFEHNSQFIADVPINGKGEFKIEITGYQKSTGNTGIARTSKTV